MSKRILTSESVTEGHPDKVCDYIADSILDEYIAQDMKSRVAVEVLCKNDTVVLAGEITAGGEVDLFRTVKRAVNEVGYSDSSTPFNDKKIRIIKLLTEQSHEITEAADKGAGDQGIMFGYATDETPELMPLPILLAHRLARGLAEDRKSEKVSWLRPDGKTQVSAIYDSGRPIRVSDALVSTQHDAGLDIKKIAEYVRDELMPKALGDWFNQDINIIVNPSGSFIQGGPSADSGLTGRKNIVDTYGGTAHHGGGSFSGKDPSKVDRSATYFCRYVARQIVREGISRKVEVQVAYAIGQAEPVSLSVECFRTGDEKMASKYLKQFDFRPKAIIEKLDLLRPIYHHTTNYGHFGRPGFPWEQ